MASSNHKVDIVVGVKDLASSALRNIQNSFNNIGKGFNSMGSSMGAFARNLDSTISKLDSMANSMYKFNMYTSSLQRNLQNLTALGVGVTGAIAVQGTKAALDYDYKMRTMQSRMGVNGTARQNISDYVLNSPDMKQAYTPSQIADIGITLGQAGVSSTADMKSLMKSVSYFAESVDADPNQAAETLVATAKGYGISMKNSQDITDKLTVALNQSLLQVDELPHAMGQLAGRATMYGQSLDSSLVALMTQRDQGVSAAQGSQDLLNALRNVSRIGNDSTLYKKTEGYFSDLGITDALFDPSTRKLKEFPELIGDIEKAMVNSGFTNPKYNIKSTKDYENFLASNNGVAPSDFWDSMKAMPLISRVFGAAGTAPIIAGLQSKYDEVDANGNSTGKTYYGASALKQMYNQVHNSSGATDQVHDVIAQSGQYQLQVLGNAWQTAQIKMMDGLVPLIKTGAEQLSNLFNPGQSSPRVPGQPLDASQYEQTNPFTEMRKALDQTVKGYEKSGHPILASTIDTAGGAAIGGIQISQVMPKMFKPIMDAFNKDIVKGGWGTNIATFPMSIVKNGIKFIADILKANKDFNDAVKGLPKDLQDPAQLIATITKGGIALMISGVVIKTIELGIRGVSGLLKAGQLATTLSKTIAGALMDKGEEAAGAKGVGGAVAKALGKTMNINANIVNVYGKAVNGGSGAGGVGGGAGKAAEKEGEKAAESAGQSALKGFASKVGPWALLGANVGMGVASAYILTHPKETNDAVLHNPVQKAVSQSPLSPQTDKKIDEMYNIIKDPSKYQGPKAPGATELRPTKNSNFFVPTVVNDKPSPASGYSLANNNTSNALISKLEKLASNNFGQSKADKSGYDEFVKNYNQITTTVKEGTGNMSNAIVSGFNSANDKLQNIKLNNQVAVNVAPPSVVVSGNIPKEYLQVTTQGSTGFTATTGTPQGDMAAASAMNRLNAITQRRIGWGQY